MGTGVKKFILAFFVLSMVLYSTSAVQLARRRHRLFANRDDTKKKSSKIEKAKDIKREGWLRMADMGLTDPSRHPDLPDVTYKDNEVFRKNPLYGKLDEVPSEDSFYFRLSGINLYFAKSKEDMEVLGAISIENIVSGVTAKAIDDSYCFEVENIEHDSWVLCTEDETLHQEWVCSAMDSLGIPCSSPDEIQTPSAIMVEEKEIVKQPILLVPLPSPYCNEKWNYMEHGDDWECKCVEGGEQSPIDLPGPFGLERIYRGARFSFDPVPAEELELVFENNIMKLKGNFGKIIDGDMTEYEAYEVQFHTPSEHQI